jgi:hypothetical protein
MTFSSPPPPSVLNLPSSSLQKNTEYASLSLREVVKVTRLARDCTECAKLMISLGAGKSNQAACKQHKNPLKYGRVFVVSDVVSLETPAEPELSVIALASVAGLISRYIEDPHHPQAQLLPYVKAHFEFLHTLSQEDRRLFAAAQTSEPAADESIIASEESLTSYLQRSIYLILSFSYLVMQHHPDLYSFRFNPDSGIEKIGKSTAGKLCFHGLCKNPIVQRSIRRLDVD